MKCFFIGLIFLSTFSVAQESGAIIDTVFCSHKPDQSYALYLPTNYNPSQKWPAIFVFEPAARGRLPVLKYKKAAEQLGYIIIASNNSKNGSWDLAFDAGDAMFLDAFNRFSIDPKRVYTSGFSGGSRVASAVASMTRKINGVIACGAGFASGQNYRLKQDSEVLYVALVGDKDMNYQEHRLLQDELDKKNIRNNKIIFNAGHQWPNSSQLLEALYWLELQQAKLGWATSNNFNINDAFYYVKMRADSTLDSGNYLLSVEIYEQIIRDFKGLIDIDYIQPKVDSIKDTRVFKKQMKRQLKINDQELAYRQEIADAFTELYFTKLKSTDDNLKDISWWRNKIDHFKRISNKSDFQMQNMGLRLINAVWARCAESSANYISLSDYETAHVLTKLWLYAEPNLWGKWTLARVLAFQNNANFYKYLNEVLAESNRMSSSYIANDPAFEIYLEEEKMRKILSNLK
ncbi:MAG: hypothetical protein ABJH05_17320 [Fulvivirga sp.]